MPTHERLAEAVAQAAGEALAASFGTIAARLYAAGHGPCIEALSTGTLSEDLANEVRWPAFSSRAVDLGVSSVLAYPLSTGPDTLGALNL